MNKRTVSWTAAIYKRSSSFVRPDQVKNLGLENHFTITNDDPFSETRYLSTRFSRTQKTILSPKPPPPPPLLNACSRAPHCQLTDFTASDSVSALLSSLLLPLSHVVPVNARAQYKIPAMIQRITAGSFGQPILLELDRIPYKLPNIACYFIF